MKLIKNKVILIICIMLIVIPFSSYASSTESNYYTVEQVRTVFLGELNSKINTTEKTEITKLVKEWKLLYDQRVKTDNGSQSLKEGLLMDNINKTLNKYTEKYLIDSDESYDSSKEDKEYKNFVVENLKIVLTQDDYKRLYELCEKYAYYDTEYSEIDSILDEVENILNKYKNLKADEIMQYIFKGSENLLGIYDIKGSELENKTVPFVTLSKSDEKITKTYPKLWKYVTSIIPESYFENFDRLIISTDGPYNDLAYVIPNDSIASRWNISIDPADAEEKNLFYETIIHEYCHYITLNDTQGSYFKKPVVKTYSDGEIVTNENSYLNTFNKKFWGILSEESPYVNDGYLFYLRHKSEFVNEYSSTVVSEDICESFAFFVLRDKPKSNTKVDQKLLFFYNYPEFVEFRNIVRNNINKVDAEFAKAS